MDLIILTFFFTEHGANRKNSKSPVQGEIPIGIFFAQTQSLQYRGKIVKKKREKLKSLQYRGKSGKNVKNSKSPVQGRMKKKT